MSKEQRRQIVRARYAYVIQKSVCNIFLSANLVGDAPQTRGEIMAVHKLASWACVLHFQKSGQPEFWKVNSASNASVIQTLIFTIFQLQENEKMNLLGTIPNPKDCQLRCQAVYEKLDEKRQSAFQHSVFSRNWILKKVRWTLVKEFFLSDNDSRDSLREIMHMNSYIIAMIQEFTNR